MRTIREHIKEERGFTLIELLVVILIVGVLAAIAIPNFLNQQNKAYDSGAKELTHAAQIATETYATDNGGSYAGMSVSKLSQYDPTINTTAGSGGAYVSSITNLTQSGYKITTYSGNGLDTFSVTRSGGSITRTCTAGTVNSGCPSSGTW